MSNKLAEGMALLATKMKSHASTTATYKRGQAWCELQVTIGRQLLRTDDRGGNTRVELTERDFVFLSDDLTPDGILTTPEDGDQIEITMNGVLKEFTVRPVGSEKSWRYADEQGETAIRVHTKMTRILG